MVDLSLDVQVKKRVMGGSSATATATLSGCLESFTSPERLMAGVYNCSGCDGTQQKATKQLRIKKLPSILCMQLKVSFFLANFRQHYSISHFTLSVLITTPLFPRKWKAGLTSLFL